MTKSRRAARVEKLLTPNFWKVLEFSEWIFPPSRFAPWVRDHVMLAWLIESPIRLGNLLEIEIRIVDGAKGVYELKMPAAKNRATTCNVPASIKPWLSRYISEFRPLIHSDSSTSAALWIDSDGQPLSFDRARRMTRSMCSLFLKTASLDAAAD